MSIPQDNPEGQSLKIVVWRYAFGMEATASARSAETIANPGRPLNLDAMRAVATQYLVSAIARPIDDGHADLADIGAASATSPSPRCRQSTASKACPTSDSTSKVLISAFASPCLSRHPRSS